MKSSQFEFKQTNAEKWKITSSNAVLGKLAATFILVSPALIEMLQGKEIATSDGMIRIKNYAIK
jgi:hypothetical protein